MLGNPVNYVDPYGLLPCFGICEIIEDIVEEVIDAVPDIAFAVAWIDVIPPPNVPLEVASFLLTEAAILLSDCSTDDKIGASILNGANLVFGIGGYVLIATTAADSGPAAPATAVVIALSVSATEGALTFATNEAISSCSRSGGTVYQVPEPPGPAESSKE